MELKKLLTSSLIFVTLIPLISSLETSGSVISSATVIDLHNPLVTINVPENNKTYSSSIFIFNVTLNEPGDLVLYSLNGGINNVSMNATSGSNLKEWTHTNSSVPDGSYNFTVYANDTSGNKNYTESASFIISTAITGGGGISQPSKDIIVCNETFYYIQEWGNNNFDHLESLIKRLKDKTGIVYTKQTLIYFIVNWQPLCSDAIGRTLKEGIVCSSMNDFIRKTSNYTDSDILNLRNSLSNEVLISDSLIRRYVKEFDVICKPLLERRPFTIVPLTRTGKMILVFIFMVFLLMIVLTTRNRKRLAYLLLWDFRKKKSKNKI